MRGWKRTLSLVIINVLICSWCGALSGISGWVMGYDMGKREVKAALMPESGVLVTRVESGGPAARAGISQGDSIVAVNGVPVKSVLDLRSHLMNQRPGEHVLITYRHNFGKQATHVVLEQFPGADANIPYLGIYFTARAETPADI